jgi:dCMP deaminase
MGIDPRAWPTVALAGGGAVLAYAHYRAREKTAAAVAADAASATLLCEPCEPCEPAAQQEGAASPPGRSALEGSSSSSSGSSSSAEPPAAPRQRTPRSALLGVVKDVGLSKEANSNVRRENYIDWHDYYMSVAMLSAFRSKDPNRQVGACIVDPRSMRIVGIGYNGFPWGCSDDALPWARDADDWMDTKYPYVCHAEMNAILNKNSASLEGCRIYTTLFPCNECAKLIIQSRMESVVYLADAGSKAPFKSARRLLNLAKVELRKHVPKVPRVVVDFEDPLAQ